MVIGSKGAGGRHCGVAHKMDASLSGIPTSS